MIRFLAWLCPKWLARWWLLQPSSQKWLDSQGLEFHKEWDKPRRKL